MTHKWVVSKDGVRCKSCGAKRYRAENNGPCKGTRTPYRDTGRIVMSSPQAHNIRVETELARRIREVFTTPSIADYKEVERRVV